MNTPPEKCRYDSCVEPPPGLALPEASEMTIPGGKFAVTRFKGAEIGGVWNEFVGACLLRKLPLDKSRCAFEYYPRGASFDVKASVFLCELYRPVGS